jgi:bifunctional UDP-N-acetylglucosamine pyrophosphorylase/glucosamine-1-phosphate N-acetyltransferase
MDNQSFETVQKLIQKGVQIPRPESVHIGPEVDIDRISGDGVKIYSGCKIFGRSVMILQGAQLGFEAPVTIEDCQVGPQVELKGGYFNQSIFLKKVFVASGAHIREGTIMEEASRAAHTVGLKQTILFPFVTLGSLINFCDCLMAGGTSSKDHSEVGSSYIHFNYTPNQDKATPSLIGDVPRGVMLNQSPIFLGGQGGLVGPCRLEFGTITAAGTICRKDQLQPGQLVFETIGKSGNIPFTIGMYPGIKRIVTNNIVFIANLIALEQWYRQIRSQLISSDFPEPLFAALTEKLSMGLDERIGRLKALSQKMPDAVDAYKSYAKTDRLTLILQQKHEFHEKWVELDEFFASQKAIHVKESIKDAFLDKIQQSISANGKDYIAVIQNLKAEDKELGTQWLQGIVDYIVAGAFSMMPAFKS